MKHGNLGDPCDTEMHVSENSLYKYMYFFVQIKLKVLLFLAPIIPYIVSSKIDVILMHSHLLLGICRRRGAETS